MRPAMRGPAVRPACLQVSVAPTPAAVSRVTVCACGPPSTRPRPHAAPASLRSARLPAAFRPSPLHHPARRRGVAAAGSPVAAAAAAAEPSPAKPAFGIVGAAVVSIRDQFQRLDGLWDRFLPMSILFFMMAFVNTIIDSLKDSLVITAVGGGTEVLPYLSVYGVLPSSVLFLVAYAWGTQRFSRERLFNVIIVAFLAFYCSFGFAYPHHETLHLSSWADSLAGELPSGLGGLVGMLRNWLFTAFYCMSELWGDVVLSLLFWGLANETTSIEDAPLLYPLFGVGANIAQTLAGRVLRVFSDAAGVHLSYTAQLQATIAMCVTLGFVILGLHTYISRHFPKNPKGSTALRLQAERAAAAEQQQMAKEQRHHHVRLDLAASVRGLNYCDVEERPAHAAAVAGNSNGAGSTAAAASVTDSSSSRAGAGAEASTTSSSSTLGGVAGAPRRAMSLKEAWAFLRRSPQIRCLAVMALAQGITTRLLEVSWKHYLHKLYTTPAAYAAFLGDTAMWTGIVTGTLMFTSPMLFERIGWRGVASATPTFMLWAGLPFFMGCIAYNFMAGAALAAGAVTLQVLVISGAVLQVFSRGAKFSLFKPAEEMVYIGLDDESRTKGKAAIDVVGAQSGKSISSVLQQMLLIITGGTVGGILPVLAVFYAVMLNQWNSSVADLAEHHDPAHVHRLSVMGSIDEPEMQIDVFGEISSFGISRGEGGAAGWVPNLPSSTASQK